MADSQTTREPPCWATQDIRRFIRALAFHAAPDDHTLSVGSLRLILADIREQARQFYEELQDVENNSTTARVYAGLLGGLLMGLWIGYVLGHAFP